MSERYVTRHAICHARVFTVGKNDGREAHHGRSSQTAMLEELSSMDRITQLQDEIQSASPLIFSLSY